VLTISRCTIITLLVSFCLICGCGSNDNSAATTNNFPVVVFSDVHFNPYYDTKLFAKLVAADPGEWADIFKTSTITGPSGWGSDTNYPSLVLAVAGIKQNLGASPLVIYTGDILGHYFMETFFELYGSPAKPGPADIAAMESFANKTVTFFMDQVRSSVGTVPVMFALGNSDSYIGAVPEPSFLSSTADLFYTKFLNSTTDQQEFLTTFTKGGYYSAEPSGTNVMVIGLNTTMFVPFLKDVEKSPADAELAWLDSRLAAAKAAGKKVWLLMHIPPGGDIHTTATKADSNGHLTAASMMWEPQYQASFLNTVANYPGIITLTFAAHTHMDEFRIYSGANVLEITPSITPYFGNNPAFKVYTFSQDTLKPIDYSSLNYDLATGPSGFNKYYTFSEAYSLQGPLGTSLTQLYPALATNKEKQALYRGHYFSGHNYSIPITSTMIPITDTNWPVFWCGIGNMGQTEFVNCVNSY
jgi:sphingomyelin phosphodiesterase acid-like 3